MENTQPKLQLPNLSEPRVQHNEANPQGIGVFFAIVRAALNEHKWARPDFDAVKFVEGQINALEIYYESVRGVAKQNPPQPAAEAPAPAPVTPAPTVDPLAPVKSAPAIAPGTENLAPTPAPEIEQEKKN